MPSTREHSGQKRPRVIRKPYDIFNEADQLLSIPTHPGNPKQRSGLLWAKLCDLWRSPRSRADLRQALHLHRRLLRILTGECLHSDYAKGSRARWLCTLRTMVRIHCGVLGAMLYGNRPHITLLLRLGPIQLLLLANMVAETSVISANHVRITSIQC